MDVDVTRQNASGKIGAALSEVRVQVQTHNYPQGGREIDTHMCSVTKKITVIFETMSFHDALADVAKYLSQELNNLRHAP